MAKEYTTGANTVIETLAEFRKIDSMEPGWLYQLRKDAWEFYLASPLPDRTTNVWRYTEPGHFIIGKPESLVNSLPLMTDNITDTGQELNAEQAAVGHIHEDRRVSVNLNPALEKRGVVLKDLYSAIRDDSNITQRYFGTIVGQNFGKFEAINLSLWNSGLYLYIPDGLIIDKPIYLLRHPTGVYTFSRLLVVIGENVQATIIDDYSAEPGMTDGLTNSAVELFVGDSANVRYVNLQRLGSSAKTYLTTRAQIGRGTILNSVFGSIGSGLTKANLGTILNGRGGNSRMYGIVFGNGKQQFDYHTAQHHKASDSFSNLNFKVALKDKAKSAYTGLIRIEKDTVNCQAYQENRNLLLNPGTKADSIPELEILTDQVICTHGATMGPIDPEMVFYLKSRGIDEAEAVKIIVAGFIEPMLNEMPENIGNMMRSLMHEKLKGE